MEIKTEKRIDAASAPRLDAELTKLIDEGERSLVVDMSGTTYISSVGLRAFLSAQKKMNKLKGSMVLTHVQPCIMEIFEVTGFGGVLTIEN
ncbi:MAG: STAS domain-containing protein [Clostridiales bacterium]|nr:STAS domain-containing protein [Clostridiales bacterium]